MVGFINRQSLQKTYTGGDAVQEIESKPHDTVIPVVQTDFIKQLIRAKST